MSNENTIQKTTDEILEEALSPSETTQETLKTETTAPITETPAPIPTPTPAPAPAPTPVPEIPTPTPEPEKQTRKVREKTESTGDKIYGKYA